MKSRHLKEEHESLYQKLKGFEDTLQEWECLQLCVNGKLQVNHCIIMMCYLGESLIRN